MDAPLPTGPVGVLAQLWRFPVKSFQGERVERAEVAPLGVVGDRRYALRDATSGHVLTAKRLGVLLEASARTTDEGVVMTLPGGGEWPAADPAVAAVLSDWLGRDVVLAEAEAAAAPVFEMSFNAEAPDTDLFEWPVMTGSHQDLAPIHALTTASLVAAESLAADTSWDVRRFRPTFLLDTDGVGFVEDAWVGRSVAVGEVVLEVTMPTIRCPMPSRAQPGLPRDTGVAATLRDHHGNNLGVYATVLTSGTVAVGDAVRILD